MRLSVSAIAYTLTTPALQLVTTGCQILRRVLSLLQRRYSSYFHNTAKYEQWHRRRCELFEFRFLLTDYSFLRIRNHNHASENKNTQCEQ